MQQRDVPNSAGARQRLRIATGDAAADRRFDQAAASVLDDAGRLVPGGAAGAGVPPRAAAITAAAALVLGDERASAATLESAAAAFAELGFLPARFDVRGAAVRGEATDAACVIALAARHLATTGARGLALEILPFLARLPAAHPPAAPGAATAIRVALRAIAESTGERLPVELAVEPATLGASRAGRGSGASEADAIDAALDEAPDADPAAVVLRTVDRRFGYTPDAARHRLELRPAPEPDWSAMHADAFVTGDALVKVEYRREDGYLGYHFEQLAGGVPVQLVLHAFFPACEGRAFLVDGAPAALDVRVTDGGVIVPVQFPLDDDRSVEVTGGSKKNPPLPGGKGGFSI